MARSDASGPGVRNGLAVLSGLPYALGVLFPYVADALHRLPPAEVASGAHDPEALWPSGIGRGLLQLLGLLSPLTPLGLAFATLLAALGTVWGVRARSATAVGFLLLALVCGVAFAWFFAGTERPAERTSARGAPSR
ncbi:MAG: hypothetical protein ACLGI3_04325 [Actinomycetes bacterium]